MAIAKSARIHPTALIDPEVEIADDVQVGPYVVVEGAVRIGPGFTLFTRMLGSPSCSCAHKLRTDSSPVFATA